MCKLDIEEKKPKTKSWETSNCKWFLRSIKGATEELQKSYLKWPSNARWAPYNQILLIIGVGKHSKSKKISKNEDGS
jgi:hypothetical protein